MRDGVCVADNAKRKKLADRAGFRANSAGSRTSSTSAATADPAHPVLKPLCSQLSSAKLAPRVTGVQNIELGRVPCCGVRTAVMAQAQGLGLDQAAAIRRGLASGSSLRPSRVSSVM